jgi:hypothetical protein
MNAQLPVFLTAYDPAELPGGTVDPLGFTAGYLVLADLLFPGMTAAAAQATYLPMLCAGLAIADDSSSKGLAAATARKHRIEIGLRFERLWALAAALQVPAQDPDETAESEERADSKVAGLRGITYVAREAERLTQGGVKDAGSEFALLAQQYRYGAFGIYGGVAEQLHLLDKSTFAATPGFGAAIGQSFLETTTDGNQCKELVAACRDKSATLRLSTLKAWGSRAYPGAPLGGDARKLLGEAAVQDPERARMLLLLERVAQASGTDSLFTSCAQQAKEADDPELFSALQTTVAYDHFLRHFTLIFERVLWLCRAMNDAEQTATVFRDPVVVEACGGLAAVASNLLAKSERLFSHGRHGLLSRGRGILEIAKQAQAVTDVPSIVRMVLKRHAEIQRGKFEQGRPKQAWIEERGPEFALTSTRIGTRSREPETPNDVRGPDWRFGAAVSLLTVTGRLAPKVAT